MWRTALTTRQGVRLPRRMMFAPPAVAPPAEVVFGSLPTEEEIGVAAWRRGEVHTREGRGRMRCLVTVAGALTACRPLADRDVDPAFNEPLLTLAGRFRVDTTQAPPPTVTVAVLFPKLADVEPELLDPPTSTVEQAQMTGDRRGEVRLDCMLTAAGRVEGCVAVANDDGTPADPVLVQRGQTIAGLRRYRPATRGGQAMATPHHLHLLFRRPRDTYADWLVVPDPDQMRALFPPRAAAAGKSGTAKLRCKVTVQGRLKDCDVTSESPPGYDFGSATLLLTPSLEFKPATNDGVPVDDKVIIPVRWELSGMGNMRTFPVRVVTWRPWSRAPSIAEMREAAPWALRAKPSALSARCGLSPAGLLERCAVTVLPRDTQTLKTAARLMKLFVTDVSSLPVEERTKLRVNVRLRFDGASLAPGAAREIDDPDWLRLPDAASVKAAFPTAIGRPEGVGAARCLVDADGALGGCAAAGGDAAFDRAAAQVVSGLRINLWTREGDPTPGAYLTVRLRMLGTGGWEFASAPL